MAFEGPLTKEQNHQKGKPKIKSFFLQSQEHERKHGNQKAKAQEKGEDKATRKKTDRKDTDDKIKPKDVKSVKETPQHQANEIGGTAKKAKAQSRRWESALKERNAIESKECTKIEGNPTKETFINASGSKRNVKLEVRVNINLFFINFFFMTIFYIKKMYSLIKLRFSIRQKIKETRCQFENWGKT